MKYPVGSSARKSPAPTNPPEKILRLMTHESVPKRTTPPDNVQQRLITNEGVGSRTLTPECARKRTIAPDCVPTLQTSIDRSTQNVGEVVWRDRPICETKYA